MENIFLQIKDYWEEKKPGESFTREKPERYGQTDDYDRFLTLIKCQVKQSIMIEEESFFSFFPKTNVPIN